MRINLFIGLLACLAAIPCLADPATPVQEPTQEALPVTHLDSEPLIFMGTRLEESITASPAEHASETSIGVPVDSGELDQLRGGESTVDNDVLIGGLVEGNSADNVVSGANAINDGAFANASGINTVIQNTGNNVLIQNGMVVNLQFVAPPP